MAQMERRRSGEAARFWDPFRELDDFRDRMSRMLEQGFTGFADSVRGGSYAPLVDVEETEDAYVFEADVPGVKREDVSVEVEGNELHVSGETHERRHDGVLRRQSRMTGRFEFRSTLPTEVDPEKVEAKLADGVLTIRVPKSERSQPRKIEVASGDGGGTSGG